MVKNKIKDIYENKYKLLMLIPLLIFIFSIIQISYQYYSTGDIAQRDLSLKGGYFVKIPYSGTSLEANNYINSLTTDLKSALNRDVSISSITNLGKIDGLMIETEVNNNDINNDVNLIKSKVIEITKVNEDDFLGTGIISSSLGDSFFSQTFWALLFAFLFMAFVVFIYIRNFAPSIAVVSAALFDIICTLAVFNLMGLKLSTAGISAFLMLIGYSVDTDILLSVKVLKQKVSHNINENIYTAMKTGLTMTLTTLLALITGIVVANSAVIQQIMTVLFIGLLLDIISTWLMNAGILRWYLQSKGNLK